MATELSQNRKLEPLEPCSQCPNLSRNRLNRFWNEDWNWNRSRTKPNQGHPALMPLVFGWWWLMHSLTINFHQKAGPHSHLTAEKRTEKDVHDAWETRIHQQKQCQYLCQVSNMPLPRLTICLSTEHVGECCNASSPISLRDARFATIEFQHR